MVILIINRICILILGLHYSGTKNKETTAISSIFILGDKYETATN